MRDLAQIRDSYMDDGLSYEQASARTAQDAMLDLIAKSDLSQNVSIKGGVLIQHVSRDTRPATTDFDFDFVRYSISDDSIRHFIDVLDSGTSEFSIALIGDIQELKHQDYKGKRVRVRLSDASGNSITTKLDIGVHAALSPDVESLCFDLCKLDELVTLLADSDEQVVTEKLKSLLRLGPVSTRYKDVFDLYYLLLVKGVRHDALNEAIRKLIFDDESMRERGYQDIASRLMQVFENKRFSGNLSAAKNDWLGIPSSEAATSLIAYFMKMND